jgi:hypothetical protein
LANVEKATPVDPASYYIDRKPEEPGFELIKVNPGRYTFFNVTVVEVI